MTEARSPQPAGTPARKRGRPRNTDIDAAVGQAVWLLLDAMGYDGLTFDAVAERAGCSRPALYRRWPTKRAMVLDVLNGVIAQVESIRPVAPGSGTAALVGWLRGIVDFAEGPGRGVLLTLSHARRRDPELAAALDEIMMLDRPKFIGELRNLLGPDVPAARLNRLVEVLLAFVLFRVVLQDQPVGDAELRALVAEQLAAARL